MSLRIIAGKYGGRRIQSHDRPGLRPTTDRVRESVFSMLESRMEFEGIDVLDLFAGTGALGIEALSRGARSCTFVESDRRTASTIEENLRELRVDDHAKVIVRDAIRFIEQVAATYDLILADPPYAATLFDRLVHDIVARGLVREHGLFVLEHSSAMQPRASSGSTIVATRGFGDTSVTIFARDNQTEAS